MVEEKCVRGKDDRAGKERKGEEEMNNNKFRVEFRRVLCREGYVRLGEGAGEGKMKKNYPYRG